jgi:hypothetical protein
MHLGNGRFLVAEIPIEHLAIYSEGHKLAVFYNKGTECICCGDAGVHLAVTTDKNGESRWIELYTSEWIVLTVDHILPKAQGGLNEMDNYQPMCRWCNSIKSDHDWTIEELRQIIRYRYSGIVK